MQRLAVCVGVVAACVLVVVASLLFALERCPPYTLGDMIKYHGTNQYGVTESLARLYADTIGGEYMLTAPKRGYMHNIGLLAGIVRRRCAGASDRVAVHVRLDDTIAPPKGRVQDRSPPTARAFCEALRTYELPERAMVVLYGDHSGGQRKQETRAFLRHVEREFPLATISTQGSVDGDFCRMVNAEVLVLGKGGFSEMAGRVRDFMGRPTIRDPLLSGYTSEEGVATAHDPRVSPWRE